MNYKQIYEEFLDLITDKSYRNKLKSILPDICDVIFNGEVQVGKTETIIKTAWISMYIFGFKCIVVAWERNDVHDQFISRLDLFNKEMKEKYKKIITNLNYFEITGNTSLESCKIALSEKKLFTTILTNKRLEVITSLVNNGDNWRIFIDEGDMSIKKPGESVCEKIQMDFLFNDKLSIFYIGATNFAIYNSGIRMNRSVKIINIPNNLYKNYEYRNYNSFVHKITDKLMFDDLDDKAMENISTLIAVLNQPISTEQPNIGLLNISRENEPKHKLALYLAKDNFWLKVIVYTGEGYIIYENDDFFKVENKCVARVLTQMQRIDLENGTSSPILIIATTMAGRAQTFKSEDTTRILTHMFIEVSDSSSVETVVQAVRGCGQYLPSQPIMNIYASSATHKRIKIANYNNDLLMKRLCNGFNVKEQLCNINFLVEGTTIPFSNRVESSTLLKQKYVHAETETWSEMKELLEDLLKINKCVEYEIVTDFIELDISKYINMITASGGVHEGEFPFENMNQQLQKNVRNFILSHVQYKGQNVMVCYNAQRQKSLNVLHHLKTNKHQCRIIAISYDEPNIIPVVVYRQEYLENPELYKGKIIVWHTTSSKKRFRAYIYTDNPPIFYAKIEK